MGPVKLFPNPNYTSKQPRDGVVPQVPCTGIFLGPSKSGKTVALISAILEQYRTADGSSVFERIYIFSPSIEIDDGWKPVKEFIENEMGVNTDREQVGRGGAADHHRPAEEDHQDQQAAGAQKTVPGLNRGGRFRGPAGIAPEDR